MTDSDADEVFDLRNLLEVLWEGRRLIVATTALAAMIAVAHALLATPTYRSEALVQPRQESKGAGLGALAAQFGGLADLAGLSLGGGGDRSVSIATLKSRALIESFIKERDLLPKLYPEKWDGEARSWKSADPRKIPSLWQAYNDFTRDILRVTEDRKTGLVTVSIEWEQPEEAQAWVTELISRTNAHLKSKAIEEGEKNLAYLEGQTQKIGQVELQRALYGLVETELKKVMIAKGSDEFALKTIDPAAVPKKRLRPKRTQIVVLGTLLGGFLGAGFVLARWMFRAS